MGGTRNKGSTRPPTTREPSLPTTNVERGKDGIDRFVWWPDGVDRPDDLADRVRMYEELKSLVPPEALAGTHRFMIDESHSFLGSAYFAPETPEKIRQGYDRGDELLIAMRQIRKSGVEVAVEEVAHRMSQVSHVGLYNEFKRANLGRYAREVGMSEGHLTQASREQRETMAGEAFAKSFAAFKTGKASSLPSPVREFWERSGL